MNYGYYWNTLRRYVKELTPYLIRLGYSYSLWMRMGETNAGRSPYSKPYDFENTRPAAGVAAPSGGCKPLNNRSAMRILGGKYSWALSKRRDVSDHSAADALWRCNPSVIWFWVFQNFDKLYMDTGESDKAMGRNDDPLANHPGEETGKQINNDQAFRTGAAYNQGQTNQSGRRRGYRI